MVKYSEENCVLTWLRWKVWIHRFAFKDDLQQKLGIPMPGSIFAFFIKFNYTNSSWVDIFNNGIPFFERHILSIRRKSIRCEMRKTIEINAFTYVCEKNSEFDKTICRCEEFLMLRFMFFHAEISTQYTFSRRSPFKIPQHTPHATQHWKSTKKNADPGAKICNPHSRRKNNHTNPHTNSCHHHKQNPNKSSFRNVAIFKSPKEAITPGLLSAFLFGKLYDRQL